MCGPACGDELEPGRQEGDDGGEEGEDGGPGVGPVLLRLAQPVHHQEERGGGEEVEGVEVDEGAEHAVHQGEGGVCPAGGQGDQGAGRGARLGGRQEVRCDKLKSSCLSLCFHGFRSLTDFRMPEDAD